MKKGYPLDGWKHCFQPVRVALFVLYGVNY